MFVNLRPLATLSYCFFLVCVLSIFDFVFSFVWLFYFSVRLCIVFVIYQYVCCYGNMYIFCFFAFLFRLFDELQKLPTRKTTMQNLPRMCSCLYKRAIFHDSFLLFLLCKCFFSTYLKQTMHILPLMC